MQEDVLKPSYALDAPQARVTGSLVETSQVMRDTDLSPGQPLQSNPPSGSLGVIGRKGVSDLINEIQENDGYDMCISEADNALDYGVESKSEADNTVDDGLENKDVEISCDTKSQNATEKETENAEDMDFEVSPDVLVDGNSCDFDSEKESENELKDGNYMDSEVFSQSLSGEANAELNVLDLETPAADIVGEGSAIDLVKDVEMGLAPNDSEADFKLIDHLTFPKQIDNGEELNSTEILQHKQSEQGAD